MITYQDLFMFCSPSCFCGGYNSPPDGRKEGDNNDYISGFIYVLYVRCCPYQSALSDF